MTRREQPTEFQSKIDELSIVIRSTLIPLIVSDYVLLDCPYYQNIGDLMIWKGELELLKEVPYRCLHQSSYFTFRDNIKIKPTATILLQGGGNFGDLWREHSEFRLKIVKKYPNNRIIIFPQSIHYQDPQLMAQDAEILARHPDLTICARDLVSYETFKMHFRNNVLLVPDMAFCMNTKRMRKLAKPVSKYALYVQRNDKEKVEKNLSPEEQYPAVEVRDWPTIERKGLKTVVMLGLVRAVMTTKRSKYSRWLSNLLARVADRYARYYVRYGVKKGVKFISSYERVYSTRLHAGVMAVLLGKQCRFIDNSYGKISAYFDTWLNDMKEVTLEKESR